MGLKRYDPLAHCPKCDHKDVGVAWFRGGPQVQNPDNPSPHVEHLRRNCLRCGYAWYELPWDAPVAAT